MQVNTTATTTKIDIPVNEPVLNKIIKAMNSVGILWDGTVNQIDRFCLDGCHIEWSKLTPTKKTKRVVYISYVY